MKQLLKKIMSVNIVSTGTFADGIKVKANAPRKLQKLTMLANVYDSDLQEIGAEQI